MTESGADGLRARLEADPNADLASLRTDTDKTLSIGQNVWRLRWCNQWTTAITAHADLHTSCGALLDALTLLEATDSADPTLDRSTVNVLINRAQPGLTLSETDQALRSLRDATKGVFARVWYRSTTSEWVQDREPAPKWVNSSKVAGWVKDLLLPRLNAEPSPFALALIDAVDDQSLQLYPTPIKRGQTEKFSLRIDGLQIGIVSTNTAKLGIGKPGKKGDGPQRRAFIKEFGQSAVDVSMSEPVPEGHITVARAAESIRALLRQFRDVDVSGAPIKHRRKNGIAVIDEHTFEARLLRGLTNFAAGDAELVRDDDIVARGSQFPTLWGSDSNTRFLDALLRRGTTPIAVEVKVATGGQGRNYRRSLIQAALYRHFIRNAADLQPWFDAAMLDREDAQCAIGLPIPNRRTPKFTRDINLLKRIAQHLDVEVQVIELR